MNRIKVLIIDDSAVVRQVLSQMLSSDPEIELVGTASDAMIGRKKIDELRPDVITLDVEMPGMDGLTFLDRLMKSRPMPVVMVSTLTGEGTPAAFRALELGAVEIVEKPKGGREQLAEIAIELVDKVKAAAQAKLKKSPQLFLHPAKKLTADAIIPKKQTIDTRPPPSERIIAIGASTGGPETIHELLQNLPLTTPGIVVVQHMPQLFTKGFAKRLDEASQLYVKEAQNGDLVEMGTVLITPGDQHMVIIRNSLGHYVVSLKDGPLVSRHRPSVDVLFRSVATAAGRKGIGIILTGMGDDGANGLLEMRQAGAFTIAEDEPSCVVFGMPRVAIERGAVDKVLSLIDIHQFLMRPSVTRLKEQTLS